MLYIGDLYPGSTCLDRLRCIESFGYEIVPFDTTVYTKGGFRISRSIGWRFNWGPLVTVFNRALCDFAMRINEISYVWIDKGVWIWPETLDKIMKQTGGIPIHYTPDPAILFHKSRHFLKCVPRYAALFTTKPFEVELYRKLGAQKIYLTYQSFERTRFYPRRAEEAYISDIAFIGHYESHYGDKIRLLSSLKNLNVNIWGPGWVRHANIARWCKPYVKGNGIWADEYPKAISSAKICLGLLSKLIPETTTTRTFEIPACGAFMLAERTDEHLALFEEGKEAEFFGSGDELLDKVKYYLAHPQQRQKIAVAGRERCLKSGYSNHDRMMEMVKIISAL